MCVCVCDILIVGIIHVHVHVYHVQSSLRTKDTLGTDLLSFARRFSLSRRFMIFLSVLIVLVSKCTEMHDKSSRDDNEVVGMFSFQYQHSTG